MSQNRPQEMIPSVKVEENQNPGYGILTSRIPKGEFRDNRGGNKIIRFRGGREMKIQGLRRREGDVSLILCLPV